MQYKQGLGSALASVGIRVEISLEKVLSGEMSLDRCVRIKS